MKWLKAFIAGIVVPSIISPIVLGIASYLGKTQVLATPFVHFIPVIWGLWNILYFAFLKNLLPEDVDTRLWITGGILGIVLSIYAVFLAHLPDSFGLVGALRYLPLLVGPVLYAVLWRFLVKDLNYILYLKD
jgi:hypothetical protein